MWFAAGTGGADAAELEVRSERLDDRLVAAAGGLRVPARGERAQVVDPVPHARVFAIGADGAIRGSWVTDEAGRLSVPDAVAEGTLVWAVSAGPSSASPVGVDACTRDACAADGTWAWLASGTERAITVPVTSPVAGALHLRRVVSEANAWVADVAGVAPLRVQAHWLPLDDTRCGTSCFGGARDGALHLYLLGDDDDSDEFDRSVILHEFAHALESHWGASGSRGGWHDGTPTDASLAFSEGIASAFALLVDRTPIYVDTHRQGGAWMDYTDSANRGDAVDLVRRSPISEDLVAEVVLSLATLAGEGALVDAWLRGVPLQAASGRAPGPAQLLHLLDALACEGGDAARAVETVCSSRGLAWRAEGRVCPPRAAAPSGGTSPWRSPITPWRVRVATASDGARVHVRARTPLALAEVRVECEGGNARVERWHGLAEEETRDVVVACAPEQVRVLGRAELANGSRLYASATGAASQASHRWRAATPVAFQGISWIADGDASAMARMAELARFGPTQAFLPKE